MMATATPGPGPQHPSSLPVNAGTAIIPDSQGVIAYARERAAQARSSAAPETIPAPPAGALFWLGWVVVGIGAGLGIHFWLAHQAAAALKAAATAAGGG